MDALGAEEASRPLQATGGLLHRRGGWRRVVWCRHRALGPQGCGAVARGPRRTSTVCRFSCGYARSNRRDDSWRAVETSYTPSMRQSGSIREFHSRERAEAGEGRIDIFSMLVEHDIPVMFQPLKNLLGAFVDRPGQWDHGDVPTPASRPAIHRGARTWSQGPRPRGEL